MTDVLSHRGPDDAGMLVDPPCVLGHRRLSIIDLSSAGHQPMASADGSQWIAFNGEIYNYIELRAELELRGRTFRTQTDTEVLLQAYAEWGDAALSRLNGMFAFAIWDRRARRLFLARDRFGVKPLYYALARGRFLFASEIKALLLAPEVRREPNDARVLDFLAWSFLDHTEETLFAGIRQLPPGSFLEVDDRGPPARPTVWYEPHASAGQGTAATIVSDLLESAVDLRLRSDVTVGVALSGGMDSSSVLGVASALRRSRGEDPPSSFSARSADAQLDEFRYSESVLKLTGSQNFDVLPRGEELVAEVDRFLWHMDEPVHGAAIYAHRKLLELTRSSGVVVLLDGCGGDEALSGYHHIHYQAMLLELLRSGRLPTLLREIAARRHLHGVAYARIVKDMLKPALPARLRPHSVPAWIPAPGRVPLRRLPQPDLAGHQRHAVMTSPLPLYNHYNDRNSMAVSIETRSPFLDYRLVEASLAFDVSDLLHRGASKWALREAMRDVLPREVVDRVDKQGFTADESRWLRGPLGDEVERTFRSPQLAFRDYVDTEALLTVLAEHRGGRDRASEIWRAYTVERWLALFVDSPRLERPERFVDAPAPVPLDRSKIVRLGGDASRTASVAALHS